MVVLNFLDTDISCLSQIYGVLMAKSTYEGMILANEQKRPFVLTRAGFVGSQRYAATWTGDNLSTWEHLHMSIPMVLQLVSVRYAIKDLFLLIITLISAPIFAYR